LEVAAPPSDRPGTLTGVFGNVGFGAEAGGGWQASGFGGKTPDGKIIVGGTAGVALGAGVTAKFTGTDTQILGAFGAPGNQCKTQALR
jgi:hypothetical protein